MLIGRSFILCFTGGNPLLLPVDDEDLLAEEDDDEEGDKVFIKYTYLCTFFITMYCICHKSFAFFFRKKRNH